MKNFENINSLEQLIAYVLTLVGPNSVAEIKKCKNEGEFFGLAHFSLGMSLRNHLKLWEENSHLYNFFKNTYDLTHADDMSGIILKKLYNVVHDDFSDEWIPAEVQKYKNHWTKVNQNEIQTFDIKGRKVEIHVGK